MFFRGQGKGLAALAILLGMSSFSVAAKAGDVVYASLGDTTRSPIGWVEFCAENAGECRGGATQPRDIVMSQTAWRDLVRVNKWVNETVKPITDMDHWGVIEKWSLPTDGYGDCEDYVLLTVKSDKGEFVLDNQNESVLAWTDTGYRFVKRQSQSDPNVWVSLGDGRPAVSTASARDR